MAEETLERFEVEGRDFRPWVEFLAPNRVSVGYNLFLFERRIPVIVDLQGRTIHHWSKVRAIGRARLDHNGNLLIISVHDSIREYDWNGNLKFEFRLPNPGDIPHHDIQYLSNGNILVLAQTKGDHSDYLCEINRKGEVAWIWRAKEALGELIDPQVLDSREATHINSIQELPDNRWYRGGDTRFRPGNILVSARNLNRLFLIDRPSGRVVWQYRGDLDYQHEAIMIPDGQLGAGLILVFNNRKHRGSGSRMSQVLALHPRSKQLIWAYEDRKFFSSIAGSQQPLPNGNVLITSTQGGRAFEITPDGETVWQWIPNVLPMRMLRYPVDHCPQLASRMRARLHAVARPVWRDFHDLELHHFDLPEETARIKLEGQEVEVLKDPAGCRVLWLPPNPRLTLRYGLKPNAARFPEAVSLTFTATLRRYPVGTAETLTAEKLSTADDRQWSSSSVPLDDYASSTIELCLYTEFDGPAERGGERLAAWENPIVYTDVFRVRQARPPSNDTQKRFDERQLRAIGYIQ